jgi:hypothetical protein
MSKPSKNPLGNIKIERLPFIFKARELFLDSKGNIVGIMRIQKMTVKQIIKRYPFTEKEIRKFK